MVGMPWTQHVAFLDDRALVRADPARRGRVGARARVASRGAALRRRQRDSAAGRALARPAAASSASCASSIDEVKSARAREPAHLRQLSADRVPRHVDASTSARSTSTCTASPTCAPISRGCSTSPASGRCCSPKPAPTASAKARDGQAAHHREPHPHRVRRRRVRRDRLLVDRRVVARRAHGARLGVRPRRRGTAAEAGAGGGARGVCRRAVHAPTVRATWPKVSVVVCAYNAADTIDDCLTSLGALTYPHVRGHRRQRRLARRHRRPRAAATRASASSTFRTAA